MVWNTRDKQGAFLANSLLKGHQSPEVIGGYKQFFNNSWLKRDKTLGMASLCLSRDVSTDMQHDLFWSL